jgi:hypothetical protein
VNAITAIPQAQERIGLSHDAALHSKIEGLVKALTMTAEFATKSPQNYLNKDHPDVLWNRAQRVRTLATHFDAVISEFSRVQGFDPGFDEPFLTASEVVKERMETAHLEGRS